MENSFITHDLGFAAFLRLNSFKLISVRKEDGLFVFTFHDPESRASELRLTYINSEFAKFDSEVKNLKKLLSAV